MTLNIEGIWSALKAIDLNGLISDYDFVVLTETFTDSIPCTIFPDHDIYCSPGIKLRDNVHGRLSGGVAVLTKKSLSAKIQRVKIDLDHIVVLKLDKSLFHFQDDCILIGMYLPPENSDYYKMTDLNNGVALFEYCLLDLYRLYGDIPVIVCGDMNSRVGCLNSDMSQGHVADIHKLYESRTEESLPCSENENDRISKDKTINTFGRNLINVCNNFCLSIVNGLSSKNFSSDFTFIVSNGCSVIDLFIVSDSILQHCQQFSINPMIEFKHCAVALSLISSFAKIGNDKNINSSFLKYKWDDSKRDRFIDKLYSHELHMLLDESTSAIGTDINYAISCFNDAILLAGQCMKSTIYINTKRKKPWYDKECFDFKKDVWRKFRVYSKYGDTEDRLAYAQKRKEYKQLLFNKDKQYKQDRLKKIQDNVNDSDIFWGIIQSLKPRTQVVPNITKEDWYNHFSDVFDSNQAHENEDLEHVFDSVQCNTLDDQISVGEIKIALNKLKNKKAAGPDNIIGEFYKNAGDVILPFLHKFFNYIFEHGLFPDSWCTAIIQPLHKKGDIHNGNADNYRGISLLNICSKLYTSILNNRLKTWINENNIIGEEQAGFREEHSTIDHVFTLMASVQKQLIRHRKLYVAFIDFRKAFDCITRDKLWSVLSSIGISTKMLKALKSIYRNVQAKVRVSGGFTDSFSCPKGLKQGEICSPILFSLLINELTKDIVQNGKHSLQLSPEFIHLLILLFADDVALLSDSVAGLQKQLDILYNSCQKLDLNVNLDKSNIVVFRNGGYLALREQWTFGNLPLSVVNTYKYLGVFLSTRLSFSRSLEDLATRAKKGVIIILKTLWSLGDHSPVIFFKLFDCQIVPILTYGAEFWGLNSNLETIEKVHLFVIKRFLGVHPVTPKHVLYGETGRYPLFVVTYVKCIKFWLRLLKLDNYRYSKKAYNMLKYLQAQNHITWVDNVRNTLYQYGFGIVWESQGVGDDKLFLKCFKQRILDCYGQHWHDSLQTRTFYSHYSSIKHRFRQHPYVSLVQNFYMRRLLARFRFGMTELKGRSMDFKQLDLLHLKRCPFCTSSNIIENEFHFLLVCPKYTDIRQKYIPNKFTRFPNLNRFCILLASESPHLISRLCNFLKEAFALRNGCL